jgi:single-stranded-DNA-specific exonuclease
VIEAAAVEEAEAMALFALDHEPDRAVIVTASPDWHPGIVGLVASRLKERFGRPAFAFALRPDGTATGSGRSVPGADLGRAVRDAVEAGLAIKGGGHAMAAGATIAADALERFRARLDEALRPGRAGTDLPEFLAIDGTLTASGAAVEIVRALDGAGPFGQGHPEPVFAFGHHRLTDVREVGTGHLRVTLKGGDGASLRGVAFRAAGQPLGRALADAVGRQIHVAGTLSLDRWGGGEKVELRLLDAATD